MSDASPNGKPWLIRAWTMEGGELLVAAVCARCGALPRIRRKTMRFDGWGYFSRTAMVGAFFCDKCAPGAAIALDKYIRKEPKP